MGIGRDLKVARLHPRIQQGGTVGRTFVERLGGGRYGCEDEEGQEPKKAEMQRSVPVEVKIMEDSAPCF